MDTKESIQFVFKSQNANKMNIGMVLNANVKQAILRKIINAQSNKYNLQLVHIIAFLMVLNVFVMKSSFKLVLAFVEYVLLACFGMDVNANIINNVGKVMYGMNKGYVVFLKLISAHLILYGMDIHASVEQVISKLINFVKYVLLVIVLMVQTVF